MLKMRQNRRLLHRSHNHELAEYKLRPDMDQRRQLVLADLGSEYRHHRGLHPSTPSSVQALDIRDEDLPLESILSKIQLGRPGRSV